MYYFILLFIADIGFLVDQYCEKYCPQENIFKKNMGKCKNPCNSAEIFQATFPLTCTPTVFSSSSITADMSFLPSPSAVARVKYW